MKEIRVAGILVALLILAIIAIRPMHWLGTLGYGWLMFWVLVGLSILYVCLRSYLRRKVLGALLWGVFIAVPLVSGFLLWLASPEFSASQIRTIVDTRLSSPNKVLGTEYQGFGVWSVLWARNGEVWELIYNEKANYSKKPNIMWDSHRK